MSLKERVQNLGFDSAKLDNGSEQLQMLLDELNAKKPAQNPIGEAKRAELKADLVNTELIGRQFRNTQTVRLLLLKIICAVVEIESKQPRVSDDLDIAAPIPLVRVLDKTARLGHSDTSWRRRHLTGLAA